MSIAKISRRHLLMAAGGTAVVAGTGGLWFGIWKAGQRRWAKPVKRNQAFAPNVYLAVGEDEQINIWLMRTEMGQGVMTALPTLIAEELDADWTKVSVEWADVDSTFDFGGMYTAASSSVISLWMELRKAGAAAREMLVAEAASRWGVSEENCRTRAGLVLHPNGKKVLSYGQLAKGAATRRAPFRPRLKAPEEFQLIGKKTPRLDIPAKISGAAKFGIDVRIKGAPWVALVRCPVRGGTLKSIDEASALRVSGVQRVLRMEEGVAVVADSTWSAQNGLMALQPSWNLPTDLLGSVELNKRLVEGLRSEGQVVHTSGPDSWAGKENSNFLEARYEVPYLAHAPMEPLNCAVKIEGNRCEVWVSSQNPDAVQELAATIVSIPQENVVVHRAYVGGGFGRRTNPDEVEEALKIAKLLGHPIHFIWSREDDISHSYYREAAAHRVWGQLAANGNRLRLFHRLLTASNRAADDLSSQPDELALLGAVDCPYSMDAHRVEWAWLTSPIRIGIWRSVGYSHNTFVLESFVDELAFSQQIDPLALRRQLLPQGSRLIGCLEKVQEMANWSGHKTENTALGIALCACFGSFAAQVAEVEKGPDGQLLVRNIWCVLDCGIIVNPDIIEAQIEGGIVFGLTAALHGRIDLQEGAVTQSNFHDYPLLRQSEVPGVHISLVKSAESPTGIGEIPVPPVAPAVLNAWFRLTGERIRNLPFDKNS